jgi:hypothetical protein
MAPYANKAFQDNAFVEIGFLPLLQGILSQNDFFSSFFFFKKMSFHTQYSVTFVPSVK